MVQKVCCSFVVQYDVGVLAFGRRLSFGVLLFPLSCVFLLLPSFVCFGCVSFGLGWGLSDHSCFTPLPPSQQQIFHFHFLTFQPFFISPRVIIGHVRQTAYFIRQAQNSRQIVKIHLNFQSLIHRVGCG